MKKGSKKQKQKHGVGPSADAAAPPSLATAHSPDLPSELLSEVAAKLPITSLLRARLVSKQWHSVLTVAVKCIIVDPEHVACKETQSMVVQWSAVPDTELLSTDAYPPQSIIPLLPLQALLGKGAKKGGPVSKAGGPQASGAVGETSYAFPCADRATIRVNWCKGLHDPRRVDQLFGVLQKRGLKHATIEITSLRGDWGEDEENEKTFRSIFRCAAQKLGGLSSLCVETPVAALYIQAAIERVTLWEFAKNMSQLTKLDLGGALVPWFGLESIGTLTKLTSLALMLSDAEEGSDDDEDTILSFHMQLSCLCTLTNLVVLNLGGYEVEEGLDDPVDDDEDPVDEDPKPMHELLKMLPKLTELRVPHGSLRAPVGVMERLQAMTMNSIYSPTRGADVDLPQLTSLCCSDLHFFTGGFVGFAILETRAVRCPSLTQLDLTGYDPSRTPCLVPVLSDMTCLTRLQMRTDSIGSSHWKEEDEIQLAAHSSGFATLGTLSEMREFTLILHDSVIPESLPMVLIQWTQLRRLDLLSVDYDKMSKVTYSKLFVKNLGPPPEEDEPAQHAPDCYHYLQQLPQLEHLGIQLSKCPPLSVDLLPCTLTSLKLLCDPEASMTAGAPGLAEGRVALKLKILQVLEASASVAANIPRLPSCGSILDALAPHLDELETFVWRFEFLSARPPSAADLMLIKLAAYAPSLEHLHLSLAVNRLCGRPEEPNPRLPLDANGRPAELKQVVPLPLDKGGIAKALLKLKKLDRLTLRQVSLFGLNSRSTGSTAADVGQLRTSAPTAARHYVEDADGWEDDYLDSDIKNSPQMVVKGLAALSVLSQLGVLVVGHCSTTWDARVKLLNCNSSSDRLSLLQWAQQRHIDAKEASDLLILQAGDEMSNEFSSDWSLSGEGEDDDEDDDDDGFQGFHGLEEGDGEPGAYGYAPLIGIDSEDDEDGDEEEEEDSGFETESGGPDGVI